MFQTRVVEKSQQTFYFQYHFSENHAVYETARKIMVMRGRPHVTIRRKRFGYKHTLRTCYTCHFSTVTMVKRKRLIVTLSNIACLFSSPKRPVQFFGPPKVLPLAYWCFFFPNRKAVGTLSQSLAFVFYRNLKIREALPHYRIYLHGVVLN